MYILEHDDVTITVFDGDITSTPLWGFVIYGPFGSHMLAYSDNGDLLTMNATPYKSIDDVMNAINILLLDDPLYTR